MGPHRPHIGLAPAAARPRPRLRRATPPGDPARLRAPILALALEPRPLGVTKPAVTGLWRIRVGELRAVYAIDDEARLVVLLRVARRAESTYRFRR